MKIRGVVAAVSTAVAVGLAGVGMAPVSGAAIVNSSGGICTYELTQEDADYMIELRDEIDEIQAPYGWREASTAFLEYKAGSTKTIKVSDAETSLRIVRWQIEQRENEAEINAQVRAQEIVRVYGYSQEDALQVARLDEAQKLRDLKLSRAVFNACVAGGTNVIADPEAPEPKASGSSGSSFAALSSS